MGILIQHSSNMLQNLVSTYYKLEAERRHAENREEEMKYMKRVCNSYIIEWLGDVITKARLNNYFFISSIMTFEIVLDSCIGNISALASETLANQICTRLFELRLLVDNIEIIQTRVEKLRDELVQTLLGTTAVYSHYGIQLNVELLLLPETTENSLSRVCVYCLENRRKNNEFCLRSHEHTLEEEEEEKTIKKRKKTPRKAKSKKRLRCQNENA